MARNGSKGPKGKLRSQSPSGKRKNDYLVCPQCPPGASWIWKSQTLKPGREKCNKCGIFDWTSLLRPGPVVRFQLDTATSDPAVAATMQKAVEALKEKGDEDGARILAEKFPKAPEPSPPPAKPTAKLLEDSAATLRRLHGQQERLKSQLQRAAAWQDELVEKLTSNIDEAQQVSAEVERLSALLRGSRSEAPSHTQVAEDGEDEFPALEESDLAFLSPEERAAYDQAKAVHEQAKQATESHRRTGEQARDAVATAKKHRETITVKKRKAHEGDHRGAPAATDAVQKGADTAPTANEYDFTDAEEVKRFIDEKTRIRAAQAEAGDCSAPSPSFQRLSQKDLRIFYANISNFSYAVREFCRDAPCDFMGFVETHLYGKQLEDEQRHLRGMGWRSEYTTSPATPASGKGSSGGALWARARQFNTFPHLTTVGGDDLLGQQLHGAAVTMVRLRHVTVALITVYLASDPKGLDLPANISKLNQLLTLVRTLGTPRMVYGDFNSTPKQFKASRWHEAFAAEYLQPDCDFTCAGSSGRMIDWGLCSPTFLPLAKSAEPVYQVPWQPHVGIDIRMHSGPAAVICTRTLLPAPIEIPDHVIQIEKGFKRKHNDRHPHAQLYHTEDGDPIGHGTDVHSHLLQDHYVKNVPYIVDTDAWEYHKTQVQDIPILDASSESQQRTAYALDPAAACDPAESYGRWAMAAEASLLSLSDEIPISDERRRGQPLRYRLGQMIRQPDPLHIQAGTKQMDTNAWISLTSQLQVFFKQCERNHSNKDTNFDNIRPKTVDQRDQQIADAVLEDPIARLVARTPSYQCYPWAEVPFRSQLHFPGHDTPTARPYTTHAEPRSIPVTTTMGDAEADPFDAVNCYDDGLDYLELLQREPENPGVAPSGEPVANNTSSESDSENEQEPTIVGEAELFSHLHQESATGSDAGATL
ncbi:unnamed protein product, partial [Prorocentrum cordatum]